ncbi:E3 ubiquitin-protein ligase RBBP6 isoform X2 [Agrilus planipennis]|nr:E3 ubiquitin-protein ligase RBBP6 isoform X2 [Agrilus planipennis]XP_025832831.1 E3 ubiquitin-protein ligase RBBP6 isoform X2 [Agrilus planipennis]
MSDSNSQELSDKSLSEFEKELEEVVRDVDIEQSTDKVSNVFTASDNYEDVLKIDENKVTQLMESANNFQEDALSGVSIENVSNTSNQKNLEHSIGAVIIQEKVNENRTISTLENNVNAEIKQTNHVEVEEHTTAFTGNKNVPNVAESIDDSDPCLSLDRSGKDSSSIPEKIDRTINSIEPSSESNTTVSEPCVSQEEHLNVNDIESGNVENDQVVEAVTVIDSSENIDMREEDQKQELKDETETVHEIFHNESAEVVIVKSFLNSSTDEGLNVETHHGSEIVIINDSEIINTSEENAEIITAITGSQTLNEQEDIQLDYLEDNSIHQEKEDVNGIMENEESRHFSTEIDGNKKIPCHVLGRNVVNPSIDLARKGRMPPKPRLGVKIPYRNLTSQIVSKDEIAEEIMERSRQRNASLPSSKDILFARKLTQRLASKLAAAESSAVKKESPSTSSVKESVEKGTKMEKPTGTSSEKKSLASNNVKKERISDNSDLLAILEGDVEMDWPETDSNKAASTKSSKTSVQGKNNMHGNFQKNENKSESASNGSSMDGDDFITEPKFSSSLVTKTYTRKRKSSGDAVPTNVTSKKPVVTEEKPSVEHKVSIDLAPNTYISKSSRIVKKKVIWDPDEAIPMSTFAISKSKIETKQATPVKSSDKKIVKTEKPNPTTLFCVKTSPDKKLPLQGKPHQVSEEKLTKKAQKIATEKSPAKKLDTQIDKKIDGKISIVNENSEKVQSKKSPSSIKKSPLKSKQHNQAHKRRYLSEVDKLLMDEGAVNMLYAVKNTEESESPSNKVKGKKKNDVFSIDNFHQELLDKTNEIKNDLQLNSSKESPKSLRKKDNSIPILKRSEVVGPTGIPLARKKSKDSVRNSTQSPPSSPAYTYTAEASRIIRRHSSSSFSSVGSHTENVNDENKSVNGASASLEKTVKHKVAITAEGTKAKKVKLTKDHTNSKKQKQKRIDKITTSKNDEKQEQQSDAVTTDDEFQAITLKRFDDVVQIVLSSLSDHLSETILNELSTVLTKLGKDDACTTVVLSSSGTCFSQGIDYNLLIEENENQRKLVAEKLALSVKDFLKTLAAFPKLLVAGINGDAMGLAVTMLPLFDIVLASDSAMFSAPYASLGCTLEGGMLLSYLPNAMHNALTSELFFTSRKLSASDALRFGLVTRTLWPDKFHDELVSTLKTISKQSPQGIMSIKKSLRHQLLSNIDTLLKIETDRLAELWASEECQSKFKEYLVKRK